MQDHRNLAENLVKRAKARGADEVDVYIVSGRSLSIELRLGRIEKLEEAGAEGLGIRVFKDGATALTHSSDLSPGSLETLIDDTLSLAEVTDADPANRLPDAALLGAYTGRQELCDEGLEAFTMDEKLALVRRMEQAGQDVDPRINNSNGAWWRDGIHHITLANSSGFVGGYQMTNAGLGVSLVAEEDGVKQTDAWWSVNRFKDRLESAEEIGREAARRTLRKLGSRPMKTQTVPVVFDPMMGGDLMQIVFEAVNGGSIFRRQSFLVDRLGETIGSSQINIVDDGTLPTGLGSRPFDAEGVRTHRTEVVRDGKLVNYLCDAYSAVKLKRGSTGSATRSYNSSPVVGTTNFYLEPGDTPPEDIIKSVKRGLYVTRLYWVGINRATGDYSRGAEGVWIEDGELTHSVQEITIASNVLDMLKAVEVVGNDLEFRSAIASPTFLVSNMVISGR